MSEYLKIPELADRLDVSEKTARTYVKSGVIPSAFIGGAYRVSEEDLEAFVESRRSKPKKAPAPLSLQWAAEADEQEFYSAIERDGTTEDLRRLEQELAEQAGFSAEELERHRATVNDYMARRRGLVTVSPERSVEREPRSERIMPVGLARVRATAVRAKIKDREPPVALIKEWPDRAEVHWRVGERDQYRDEIAQLLGHENYIDVDASKEAPVRELALHA